MNKKLQLIQKTKESIRKLSDRQDELYNDLVDELGIDAEDRIKDYVFDYIFNGTMYVWHDIKKEFGDECSVHGDEIKEIKNDEKKL